MRYSQSVGGYYDTFLARNGRQQPRYLVHSTEADVV
jgi:hypothetical protein